MKCVTNFMSDQSAAFRGSLILSPFKRNFKSKFLHRLSIYSVIGLSQGRYAYDASNFDIKT